MQLSNIKQFLDVYRKSLDSEDEKKEHIQRIIQEETQIIVNTKMIILKKGVLEIKANTIIKNELFFYKEKIISRFKKEAEKNTLLSIHDIR
jgi:hypothetical protein